MDSKQKWPKLEAPQPISKTGRCFLFAGITGESADGWIAFKGRFSTRDRAKESCAANGYTWAQIVIYDTADSLWCVEDYGIDTAVDGWREVNIDEPYRRT